MTMAKELTFELQEPAKPVASYPFQFRWYKELEGVFDLQVELLREDIARARAEDKMIIYLSCPISSRGGGFSATNVEMAKFTQAALLSRLGHRFWVLNPAMYQMESKEGTGLLRKHAHQLNTDWSKLPRPGGGDYMRMWTKVLVEELLPRYLWATDPPDAPAYLGGHFDAYYFLGPQDVHSFFTNGTSMSLTDALEAYFARKFSTDPDFRDAYSMPPGIHWGHASDKLTEEEKKDRNAWEERRKAFFRYYGLRASVAYSLGSHDEWNLFVEINRRRREKGKTTDGVAVWDQLAGYFEGRQIAPGAAEVDITRGYDVRSSEVT